jgi:CheY-like chemotaxis protein
MPNEADDPSELEVRATNAIPRILVVDDEQVILEFAHRVLSDAGYDVAIASRGVDALKLTDTQSPFDLFVIDVLMPEMRGDELAPRLFQRFPNAKVLYFTGHSDSLFETRNVLWESEAFIDKPVTIDGLLEAVSMILFGHTQGLAL